MGLMWKRVKFAAKIVFALYGIIVAGIAYSNWNSQGAEFASLVDNWREVPYANFSVISAGECTSLGSGFYEAPYTQFEGANNWCFCPTTCCSLPSEATFKGKDFASKAADGEGVCWTNMTTASCFPPGSTPARPLNVWRGGKFCVRRFQGVAEGGSNEEALNAINRPYAFGSAACPTGFHKCVSSGSVLTNQSYQCAPNGEPCPITSFTISTSQVSSECMAIASSGYYMCAKRLLDGIEPLVKFGRAVNGVCSPGKSESVSRAENDPRIGTVPSCVTYDARWTTVDSLVETVVYSENGLAYPWSTTAPNNDRSLPIGSSTLPYRYQSRDEIGWDVSCPKDRRYLADLEDDVDNLTSAQLAVLVINILLGVSIGLAYNVWECRQKDDDGWDDDTPAQVRRRRCKIGVVIIGNIIKCIPLAVALILSFSLHDAMSQVSGHNGGTGCATNGEISTNKNIEFFEEETAKQQYLNIALLVGAVLEVGFELFSCYQSCNRNKDTAVELD
jgi:hypothetical protein